MITLCDLVWLSVFLLTRSMQLDVVRSVDLHLQTDGPQLFGTKPLPVVPHLRHAIVQLRDALKQVGWTKRAGWAGMGLRL